MDHVEGPLCVLLMEKEGQPYLACYISLACCIFIFQLIFLEFLHWRGRKEEDDGSS